MLNDLLKAAREKDGSTLENECKEDTISWKCIIRDSGVIMDNNIQYLAEWLDENYNLPIEKQKIRKEGNDLYCCS